jgi:hypothetical protein
MIWPARVVLVLAAVTMAAIALKVARAEKIFSRSRAGRRRIGRDWQRL